MSSFGLLGTPKFREKLNYRINTKLETFMPNIEIGHKVNILTFRETEILIGGNLAEFSTYGYPEF